jgi:hypothetical protein
LKAPVYKVSPHVGRNPVAQAVARNQLRRAILDQRIGLYSLQDGDKCADMLGGVCLVLQTIQLACQTEGIDTTEARFVKSGLNACLQVVLVDRFDRLQIVAIDKALTCALGFAGKLKPTSIQKALK